MHADLKTAPPRVLMLAPHPVLEPRGSSIHVFQRLCVLSELGYAVDLLTYPIGKTFDLPNVRVFRVWRPFGLRRVRIGPSAAKLVLDLLMALSAVRRLVRGTYVAIHSHEEAAFIGVACSRLFGLPHLYDMHSSLPQQFENWGKTYAPMVSGPFRVLERWAVRRSDVVVTISPLLRQRVHELAPGQVEILVENTAVVDRTPDDDEVAAVRARHGLGEAPVMLYAGNLEPYQGIDLLLQSFSVVRRERPDARLVIVGGSGGSLESYRRKAVAAELGQSVAFVGRVATDVVGSYLAAADILVSPRVSGTNTPMKIYSYLRAGRPIVATDLCTHTQVVTDEVARLAPPEPEAFGQALLQVLEDRRLAASLADAARRFSEQHGEALYRERIARAYELLLNGSRPRRGAVR